MNEELLDILINSFKPRIPNKRRPGMNLFHQLKLVFIYGPELDQVLQTIRKEQEEKERLVKLHNLNLCWKHQQEQNHSHFSKQNCHYCQALANIERLNTAVDKHNSTFAGTMYELN